MCVPRLNPLARVNRKIFTTPGAALDGNQCLGRWAQSPGSRSEMFMESKTPLKRGNEWFLYMCSGMQKEKGGLNGAKNIQDPL